MSSFPSPGALPASVPLIYAVGDVHGRADLLRQMVDFIADEAERTGREPAVIMLGDLVDRGPDSQGVLDCVIAVLDRWPASRLCLGNHDAFFLSFLDDRPDAPAITDTWLDQGGDETLRSYGLARGKLSDFRLRILEEHPRHLTLLQDASLMEVVPDFVFVHAGIDPHRPLAAQNRDDLVWIRAPFLQHVGRLERIVVHGHTPQKPLRPHVTENRISLDTGAYASGILSALRFDPQERTLRFVATDGARGVASVEPARVDRGFGTVLDRFG